MGYGMNVIQVRHIFAERDVRLTTSLVKGQHCRYTSAEIYPKHKHTHDISHYMVVDSHTPGLCPSLPLSPASSTAGPKE